jgi:hypothetical protein
MSIFFRLSARFSLAAMVPIVLLVCFAVSLVACGGGGGVSPAALTVSSGTATGKVANGTSASLGATATVTDPSAFTSSSVVYAFVVDSEQILSGSVSIAQIDPKTYSLTVLSKPTLAPKRYTGVFDVMVCKDRNCNSQFAGSPLKMPYDFTVLNALGGENALVASRALIPSSWGVGFSSTPTGSALTRSLKVNDNFDQSISWNAASDKPWLQVSSSGTSPSSELLLTANPASLPDGEVSYANVTISSNVVGVAPAMIRVGLWKNSVGASASSSIFAAYREIKADPIRPYIYANNGGATIDVYNAYTSQLVRTITNVGSFLGAMAISPDGDTLYAMDIASGGISRVNLTSMTLLAPWRLSSGVLSATNLLVTRPNGHELVLVGDGSVYSNGKNLGNVLEPGVMVASSDGRSVFVQNEGISPASLTSYDFSYGGGTDNTLTRTRRISASNINGASNGQDIAFSPDNLSLFSASGAPYICSRINPVDLRYLGQLPGGNPYPNNVEVTQDGRVICGISGGYDDFDFWVHSSAGALIKGYKLTTNVSGGLLKRQLVVTPDSYVVAALQANSSLIFKAIGP